VHAPGRSGPISYSSPTRYSYHGKNTGLSRSGARLDPDRNAERLERRAAALMRRLKQADGT